MVNFIAKSVCLWPCFCRQTNLILFDCWFLTDPLRTPLNWRTRLQIAVGVVAALVCCVIVTTF